MWECCCFPYAPFGIATEISPVFSSSKPRACTKTWLAALFEVDERERVLKLLLDGIKQKKQTRFSLFFQILNSPPGQGILDWCHKRGHFQCQPVDWLRCCQGSAGSLFTGRLGTVPRCAATERYPFWSPSYHLHPSSFIPFPLHHKAKGSTCVILKSNLWTENRQVLEEVNN